MAAVPPLPSVAFSWNIFRMVSPALLAQELTARLQFHGGYVKHVMAKVALHFGRVCRDTDYRDGVALRFDGGVFHLFGSRLVGTVSLNRIAMTCQSFALPSKLRS